MLLKLECHDPVAAMYVAAEWPELTYKRGTAVIVCDMPPSTLAHIEQMTGADRGEVTDDDRRVVAKKFGDKWLHD